MGTTAPCSTTANRATPAPASAAHVMAEAPAVVILTPPSLRSLIWTAAEDRGGHTRAPSLLERPPKA